MKLQLLFYLGLIHAQAKVSVTDGPLLDLVNYFEIHLSPQVLISSDNLNQTSIFLSQAITDTVLRSLLSVGWELISRIVTTFMLFGVFESVS